MKSITIWTLKMGGIDMNGIGTAIIILFILYWVIRFAVRDGIKDSKKDDSKNNY